MKRKIIAVFVTCLLMFAITACGASDKQESKPKAEEETQDLEAEEEPITDLEEDENVSEEVASIDIDSGDTKISYEKSERTTLEGGEEVILLYFNFTNVSAGTTTVDSHYNFKCFQDGVEITTYATIFDEIEAAQNREKEVLDGTTIEIAVAVEPDNWDSPISLQVDDDCGEDIGLGGRTYQMQEIPLQ